MSGVDDMNYLYSINSNNGLMRMTVNFDVKTDPNFDQMLAQLRESQAERQYPPDVRNLGVTVQKSLSTPLLFFTLYSPNGTYDASFLANYAYIHLNDLLTRVGASRASPCSAPGSTPCAAGCVPISLPNSTYGARNHRGPAETEHGEPGGPDRRRRCRRASSLPLQSGRRGAS